MGMLLWVALAASPSVAIGELKTVDATRELATFAAEHVGQQLGRRGLKVITQGDVAATLGLERQRQLLGCAEDAASCSTELAQALGVDLLLVGTLARLGELEQVDLKLLSAKTAEVRASFSGATTRRGELPALLERAANELFDALVPPRPAPGVAFWAPLGAGVALLAAGGVCVGLSQAAFATLSAPASQGQLETAVAQQTRERGKVTQVLGPVLLGVGGAAIATALVAHLATQPPAVPVVVLDAHGAALVLTGAF